MSSPPSHNESFERLHQLMAQLAHRFLTELGGFMPFGGGIQHDGNVLSIALDPEWDVSPEEQIEALAAQLDVGRFAGGAVVADVQITPPGESRTTDAVQMIIETRSGFVQHAFLPYTIDDDGIHYGKPLHGGAGRKIFLGRSEEDAARFDARCKYINH